MPPGEVSADPLDALKDAWHQFGYCLGRTMEGTLMAFFIWDENPMERLLEAETPEELDAQLEADWQDRRGGDAA